MVLRIMERFVIVENSTHHLHLPMQHWQWAIHSVERVHCKQFSKLKVVLILELTKRTLMVNQYSIEIAPICRLRVDAQTIDCRAAPQTHWRDRCQKPSAISSWISNSTDKYMCRTLGNNSHWPRWALRWRTTCTPSSSRYLLTHKHIVIGSSSNNTTTTTSIPRQQTHVHHTRITVAGTVAQSQRRAAVGKVQRQLWFQLRRGSEVAG